MSALTDAVDDLLCWGMQLFPLHYPAACGEGLKCSCGNPRCPDAAKHPYGRHVPRGLHDATNEATRIDRWWSAGVPYNVDVRRIQPTSLAHLQHLAGSFGLGETP